MYHSHSLPLERVFSIRNTPVDINTIKSISCVKNVNLFNERVTFMHKLIIDDVLQYKFSCNPIESNPLFIDLNTILLEDFIVRSAAVIGCKDIFLSFLWGDEPLYRYQMTEDATLLEFKLGVVWNYLQALCLLLEYHYYSPRSIDRGELHKCIVEMRELVLSDQTLANFRKQYSAGKICSAMKRRLQILVQSSTR